MRIYSSNKKSWISLDIFSNDKHDYSSFSLEAVVDVNHSYFQGKNTDLHFSRIDDFVFQLNAFIIDRSIQPKLNGTYDSYLMFKGSASHVLLSFCIGSAYWGIETYSYAVYGTFEIDQENLELIASDFSKLFAYS